LGSALTRFSSLQPYHNVLITNSSFPRSVPQRPEVQTTSAYLFPSFKYIPFLPRVSFDSVQALVKGYLLPTKLNSVHDNLSPIHKDRLLRSTECQSVLYGVQDVEHIMVLICGHGSRDGRCGVLGPVIQEEFKRALPREGIEVLRGPVPINLQDDVDNRRIEGAVSQKLTARTGIISHIGGHKFAGNVIIYIPQRAKAASGKAHALAGCGVWYGRVEPRHVEGIVTRTILGGEVFKDHFRGGITQDGEILRL
jgi:(2Fe-2S) ferredoxin